MKKITEDFLHFLWKNQFMTGISLEGENGDTIEVLDPGEHNRHSGPDFFNSRIRICGTTWAGNVEIHINASDWLKHRHQSDRAYDSVILHVVYFNDVAVTRTNNLAIPTALIRFPLFLWEKYSSLMNHESWIQCEQELQHINPVVHAQWISRIMIEKLSGKYLSLRSLFTETNSHWEDLLNKIIFRCFGLPVNTLPFEMLASNLPYNLLIRSKQDLRQLESLLFGISGMLDTCIPGDIYMQELKNTFHSCQHKLKSGHVPKHLWRFMRMRPPSFPTIRISQMAYLIHQSYPLSEKLKTMPSMKKLNDMLRVRASDYWNTHFVFGKHSTFSVKYTGEDFVRRLVINGIVPYMFFMGKYLNDQAYCEYAISLLEQIPTERNAIIKKWSKFGVNANNSLESQGLLYLYGKYCKHKECLNCQFGNYLILHGKTS